MKSGTIKKAEILEDDYIKISFPYRPQTVADVKTLRGRTYSTSGKYWMVPFSAEAVISLREWGFTIIHLKEKHFEEVLNKIKPVEINGLKRTLYPFQNIGVSFIEHKHGRVLLADEMGLGKTVQALAWLQLHPDVRPALIVTPSSLKLNWRREARKWLTPMPSTQILDGKTPYPITEDIIIINYDIIANWEKELIALRPKVMITDECHYYKNNSAARTKSIKKIAKSPPHFIAISGTPIMSRPIEVFNAVNIIDSTVFPSFFHFAKRYCDAKYTGFGWSFKGASNVEELHSKLTQSCMIRRLKKEVLPDLPPKILSYIPMEINNRSEYTAAENDFVSFVQSTKGNAAAERASSAASLAEIEGLKQIAVAGKLDACVNWISTFLESGEKLVVFATHKFVIAKLMEAFPGISVKLDGSTSNKEKDQNVMLFQQDPEITLFVANIQAGGVGLTLTAASNVAFLELPWTPAALSQAIDRLHRIGQVDSVTAWFLLAENTIDETIAQALDEKLKIVNSAIDGIETSDESLLINLIEKYAKKD